MARHHLLIIEDDEQIITEIKPLLEAADYLITHVKTIAQTKVMDMSLFSGIICDWNLPDGEGIHLVEKIRRQRIATPILMLTAKVEVADRIQATNAGATDFLGKPFYFHELKARLSLMLTKRDSKGSHGESTEISGIIITHASKEVTFDGKILKLTPKEYDLLLFFLINPKKAFAREELLDAVWGEHEFPSERTVDTHVLQLRKKIDADFFETVWGTGYRFMPKKD
jgi:DNA-binding response OmpR family regulator